MSQIDERLRLPLHCPFDHFDRDTDDPVVAIAVAPQIAGDNDPYPLVYLPVCGNHLFGWRSDEYEDGGSDLPAFYLDGNHFPGGRLVPTEILTGVAGYSLVE